MSAVRSVTGASLLIVAALLMALVGCGTDAVPATGTEAGTSTTTSSGTTTSTDTSIPVLEPVVTPTLPAVLPGYSEADPLTGLHVTGTPQVVDVISYRLRVFGKVAKELSLSYDEIRTMPKISARPKLDCPGEFVDVATWAGVPLRAILELAVPQPGAVSLVMNGADGYSTVVSLEDALQPQNFLAYELEGETLPALHGFPLRAVFPGRYGAYWVKWLLTIEVK